MPFVSDKQRRACFAIMRRYNKMGIEAPWDCHQFAKGTLKKSNKKSSNKKPKKSGKKGVFIGPRGGEYKLVKNKKVYLKH